MSRVTRDIDLIDLDDLSKLVDRVYKRTQMDKKKVLSRPFNPKFINYKSYHNACSFLEEIEFFDVFHQLRSYEKVVLAFTIAKGKAKVQIKKWISRTPRDNVATDDYWMKFKTDFLNMFFYDNVNFYKDEETFKAEHGLKFTQKFLNLQQKGDIHQFNENFTKIVSRLSVELDDRLLAASYFAKLKPELRLALFQFRKSPLKELMLKSIVNDSYLKQIKNDSSYNFMLSA